jgi:transposase-like protein
LNLIQKIILSRQGQSQGTFLCKSSKKGDNNEMSKIRSSSIVKNGSTANGKKKFLCKECGRQFVENPQDNKISDEKWRIAGRLLLEKISLAGIARDVSISKRWIQEYVEKK